MGLTPQIGVKKLTIADAIAREIIVRVNQHGTAMDILFNLSRQVTMDHDTAHKHHQRQPKYEHGKAFAKGSIYMVNP